MELPSDSSDEGEITTTSVLLGYASEDPTGDDISYLGGSPVSALSPRATRYLHDSPGSVASRPLLALYDVKFARVSWLSFSSLTVSCQTIFLDMSGAFMSLFVAKLLVAGEGAVSGSSDQPRRIQQDDQITTNPQPLHLPRT